MSFILASIGHFAIEASIHALAMISSKLSCTGFHLNISFTSTLDAANLAGSPVRHDASIAGIECPVTFLPYHLPSYIL